MMKTIRKNSVLALDFVVLHCIPIMSCQLSHFKNKKNFIEVK